MVSSVVRSVVRFWGRKPIDLCTRYIQRYSRVGDVVLDCFGGSGSTIQSALLLGRKAIYVDANPYAWLIAYVLTRGVDDVNEYLEAVSRIVGRERVYYVADGVKHWVRRVELYRLLCPHCKSVREVKHYRWWGEKCIALLDCNHTCSSSDLNADIPPRYPYPRLAPLYYEDGAAFDKRRNVSYVHELFTKRNLLLLSTLLHDIDSVSRRCSAPVSLALYLTFASILFDSSRMAREGAGSWGVPCYWIPERHIERNPYKLFERRSRLLAGYFTLLNKVKEKLDYEVTTNARDVVEGECDIAVTIGDATNMDKLPSESVDMVFTDPPHTDEIQYFELSYFYWSWLASSRRFNSLLRQILGFQPKLDFKIEVCVNRRQGKTLKVYASMLCRSIAEIRRVLKRNKYAIILFHEEYPKVKNYIVNELTREFTLENVIKEEIKQRNIGKKAALGNHLDVIVLLKRS